MNSLASGSVSVIKKQTPVLFSRARQPTGAGAGTSLLQEGRQDPTAQITACQSTGDTEAKAKQISRDLGLSSPHFLACAVGQTMGYPLLLLVLDQETMLAWKLSSHSAQNHVCLKMSHCCWFLINRCSSHAQLFKNSFSSISFLSPWRQLAVKGALYSLLFSPMLGGRRQCGCPHHSFFVAN